MLREFKAITFYSKTLHLWNFISTSGTNSSTISQRFDTELNIRQLFKPPVLIILNHTFSLVIPLILPLRQHNLKMNNPEISPAHHLFYEKYKKQSLIYFISSLE